MQQVHVKNMINDIRPHIKKFIRLGEPAVSIDMVVNDVEVEMILINKSVPMEIENDPSVELLNTNDEELNTEVEQSEEPNSRRRGRRKNGIISKQK